MKICGDSFKTLRIMSNDVQKKPKNQFSGGELFLLRTRFLDAVNSSGS